MENPKASLQLFSIAKINLRHNFLPLALGAAALLLLSPLLFGLTMLDSAASAVPLEMLAPVIGIILLTPVFTPEQNSDTADIIASKYLSPTWVHLIRVGYSVIGMTLMISIFSLFMLVFGCEINLTLVVGAIADGLFLGSLGLAISAISNNITVSLMIASLYYILNLTLQSDFGCFNLFGMTNGDFSPNPILFGTGVILLALSVLTKRLIQKLK